MKQLCRGLGIALFAAGRLSIGGQATSGDDLSVGDGAFVAQNGAGADSRLAFPSTIDRTLKSEIEAAATSDALEQVLLRHPDQGQLIVPRIEALAIAEIKTDGPGSRFAFEEMTPDTQGARRSVTMAAAGGGVLTLSREYPGDGFDLPRAGVVPSASFGEGSVHRYAGRVPLAETLTIFGDGDKDHRLTFAILADYGMVYLRGTGRVVLAAGGKQATIQLGSPR
jgi:hypothetical protein